MDENNGLQGQRIFLGRAGNWRVARVEAQNAIDAGNRMIQIGNDLIAQAQALLASGNAAVTAGTEAVAGGQAVLNSSPVPN